MYGMYGMYGMYVCDHPPENPIHTYEKWGVEPYFYKGIYKGTFVLRDFLVLDDQKKKLNI